MAVLIGTREGVYRAESLPFSDVELVLDCGETPRIKAFDDHGGIFVASRGGLFRSTNGYDWSAVAVPQPEVWDVIAHDGALFAGTFPAHLYRSTDGGDSWEECTNLRSQPSTPKWRSPFADSGRVRTVAGHPDAPERLVLGLEAGGYYRSEDGGERWARWDVAGQDDFHHIIPLGPSEYIVACGRLSITDRNHGANEGGLYHTDDAGDSWTRLDDDLDHSYFRQALLHDGRLYAGGSLTIPPVWLGGFPADASLFFSEDLRTFEEQSYPGGPEELILAWGVHDGDVIAGTAGGGIVGPGDPKGGRVIREVGNGVWDDCGTVPHDVHSLLAL